jgi:hypothetical protein
MQQEKDKHGITREDELRAEPVPWCHSESLIDIR